MLIEALEDDFNAMPDGIVRPGLYLAPDTVIAPPEVMEMLRNLAGEIRQNFAPAAWWIVDDSEVVGLCSLIQPPVDGDLHIGYGVAPSRQRRGFATRAVAELVAWASSDPRVAQISAETGKRNLASQRVLERTGFQPVGERLDAEDGIVTCWRISVA